MGVTCAAYFRDKLAMRTGASESGFLVPEFCRVLNYDELRAYIEGHSRAVAAEAASRKAARRWVSAKSTSRKQALADA